MDLLSGWLCGEQR